MHKQLVLLHNAVSAYFSGNAVALEGTIKQFNVKVDEGFKLVQQKINHSNSFVVTAEITELYNRLMARKVNV